MSRELLLGCIGCGFIADIHLRNAARLPGVRLWAAADVRLQAAQDFQNRFGGEYATKDAQRVLDDPAVDAVLICTHPDSHAGFACAAARAGKHVFLEKPMAPTSDECREIRRVCRDHGTRLAIDLKFRFSPAVRAVKAHVPHPVLIFAQTSMDPFPDGHDHVNPRKGGGILGDLGTHSLDLACHLAGAEPVSVFAIGNRLRSRTQVEFDAIAGTLEFSNGAISSFLISDCGEWAHPSKWFFEVSDGARKAVITDHCRTALLDNNRRSIDEPATPAHEIGTLAALEDFLSAIHEDRDPLVSGLDGLRAAVLVEAVHASLASRRPVAVGVPD
ncbi:MAG TPA: Gfo/Idh/MocA family oxidoreductase [Bryobacteraceae bacterium]|nr:Gfo/Idh/MocA family oxidoreductase [Bryobacteraceae bacterium]